MEDEDGKSKSRNKNLEIQNLQNSPFRLHEHSQIEINQSMKEPILITDREDHSIF